MKLLLKKQIGEERLLTLIEQIILVLLGLSGGVIISGGIFAFITMIGIIPRFASKTNTANKILLYEDCVVVGGSLGNLVHIYRFNLPIGHIGMLFYGAFSGVFVGCLAIALAETLDTIPVFAKRINLKKGIAFIILGIALGKGVGSFIQLFYYNII